MKAKALYTILSKKLKDGEVLFIDSFNFEKPKTKEALDVLKNLSSIKGFEKLAGKKNNAAYVGVGSRSLAIEKSFSNIGSIKVDEVRNMNPLDILNYKFVVITNPEESINFLAGKLK
jgi:large subunit ribosomal protein L4